jgi:Flp pilus assembly protein TadG
MMQAQDRVVRRFSRDASGSVAILFAIGLIPILLGIGAAIDYGRALIVRERMADAADAAALAIGSWQGLSQQDLKVKAQQYFDANYSAKKIGTTSALQVSFANNDIIVSVTGKVPTTFMKLANVSSMDVGASSTVTVGMGTLEVALVLDNSGSMGTPSSKLSALKTAANELVDILFDSAQYSNKPDPIKISVVPFAASVNVGPDNSGASWISPSGANTADSLKAFGAAANTNVLTLFNSLKDSSNKNITWGGCVEARPMPNDVTDSSSPGFAPMFAPDEPDNWNGTSGCSSSTSGHSSYTGSGSQRRINCAPSGSKTYNNYLPDAGRSSTCSGTANARWTCENGNANCGGSNVGVSEENAFGGNNLTNAKLCKYGTSSNKASVQNVTIGGLPGGPNFMCTTKPLLTLSKDKAIIKSEINEMVALGATNVGEGAMWGWRTLSPGAPFTEGRAYDTEENQKVLVLMTDGANTYYPQSNIFLKSWYGAYGYVERGRLGTTSTNSSTLTEAMDDRTLEACTNIKKAGIIVYTVGFEITGTGAAAALDLLKKCASDKDKYFAPDSEAELLASFNAIGKDISDLRISK